MFMIKMILLAVIVIFSKVAWSNESEINEKMLDESSLKRLGFEFLNSVDSDSIQFNLLELNQSAGIESVEFAIAKDSGELIFSQYLSIEKNSLGPFFSFRKYDLDSNFEYIFLLNVNCKFFPEFRSCKRNGGEFLYTLKK